jgi:hypothetical protein
MNDIDGFLYEENVTLNDGRVMNSDIFESSFCWICCVRDMIAQPDHTMEPKQFMQHLHGNILFSYDGFHRNNTIQASLGVHKNGKKTRGIQNCKKSF